jgi:hypothetical protein
MLEFPTAEDRELESGHNRIVSDSNPMQKLLLFEIP